MNIHRIYIEEAIRQHPRVKQILQRFPKANVIECQRYGEVFNPKAQNFRLQKQQPALILAEKYKNYALSAPPNYGIGAQKNYYFSHMLNCLYDCRYCFLQGMYQSANYVLFVNYEDYQTEISRLCHESPDEPIHFFSGYDCDSLAFEPITDFAAQFLPLFEKIPNAWLELRTKSTQIRNLLNRSVVKRCIVAFSLSPDEIAQKVEAKAPTLEKRLAAMVKLQQQGWTLGLRFDPLIYHADYQKYYGDLFAKVFEKIMPESLHSVSLGTFRLPEKYFKKIHNLYPNEKLFASPLSCQQGMVSYKGEIEQQMMSDCTQLLLNYIPPEKFFPCTI
ncbi:MAG: DNA photolyase [Methylococcales bacterium]|nr:DNA photolyase [Methylococcales bacterium]